MDHAQGRAFHHHLARAIMHLNYLAGLLPFFEPSIEWDDPTLDHQFRTGRQNHVSRSLHTFVPLPASSSPPTMVSHGGIPSHMIVNPEPNLRPLTVARYPREVDEQNPNLVTIPPEIRYQLRTQSSCTSGDHIPAPDLPQVTTRITTPVPVRSKQRATSTEDPQTKKKQKSASGPESTSRPVSLPIISEQALIQLWQPRLNTPFIYQFFSCRKGLIARSQFSSSRQFGTFSLWRKLRWSSTPQHVRRALHSPLFHRRVRLWEIIQDLGSNSIRRFHMEKKFRSNEIGAQGCYFIRRLANNLGEPQRSYAINAIDRALKFWKAKPVRKPTPL